MRAKNTLSQLLFDLYCLLLVNIKQKIVDWIADNLLVIAVVASLIFVLLIPTDVWKLLFWGAAVLLSGGIALYALLFWIATPDP